MFIKNLLKPGDYLMPVPAGISITIEYDYEGRICKCYKGWQNDKELLDNDFVKVLRGADIVPNKIAVVGGKTDIAGVLYTGKYTLSNSGDLPSCISSDLINVFISDPNSFSFFAGNIDSMATTFRGSNPIVNWLSMNGFKPLPAIIVPANLSKSAMQKLLVDKRFTDLYNSTIIANYMIYRGGELLTAETGLNQFVVSRVNKFIDDNGYIKAKLSVKGSSDNFRIFNYSDIVRFNINTNSLVVVDADNEIVFSTPTDNKSRDRRSKSVTCDVCGRPFMLPDSGLACCPDEHCKSKWLFSINKLLRTFKLPEMTRARFDKVISDVVQISDIFALDEYKDCKISATLSDILVGLMPVDSLLVTKTAKKLASKCKNEKKAFIYYINNPQYIADDLNMVPAECKLVVDWLSDIYNQQDVESILDLPNIEIAAEGKSFDGPPIFRGKTIMITGKFHHGANRDIEAILRSYSADVVTELTPSVSCILIGDILEGIDAKSVRYCRNNNIPVMTESKFFNQYDIDSDLAENLV